MLMLSAQEARSLRAVIVKVLTFKGERVHEEISEVEDKWGMLGLSRPGVNFYGGEAKCIVLWEKVKRCPAGFPRREGLAGTKHFWE